MNETRQTEIVEKEIETSTINEEELSDQIVENESEDSLEITQETVPEEEIDPRVKKRDQLFEEIKNRLLKENRLLTKFFKYSDEHCEFDYEEMGLSFEEEEDHLRRTNKLKDKILDTLEESLEIKCDNREIDTLHNMIICDAPYEEEKFRIVIEVLEDSFDLEVI